MPETRSADPSAARANAPSADARDRRQDHDGDAPPRRRRPLRDRPLLAGTLMAIVMVAAIAAVLWWRHSRRFEATDDAMIDVVAERVSPQVAGRVTRVLVNDNQDVVAGQVLVELDPADFQNRLVQAQAAQAQAEAAVAEAQAAQAVAAAQREQAAASEAVAAATARNAANDLGRFRQLSATGSGAVTPQQLDKATADAASTAAQLHAAQQAVAVAAAQLTHALKQVEAAQAGGQSAAAQVAEAERMLSYAQIRAATAGRIARRTVAPGNFVQPGADLMAVVPAEVYLTANFKETQLARMRRGQPVAIRVDAYPDLQLTGRVDSVQPATGQAFEVLPAQNAAGNWVKVVQRVPVKIVLDRLPAAPEQRLGPGMSARVKVQVK